MIGTSPSIFGGLFLQVEKEAMSIQASTKAGLRIIVSRIPAVTDVADLFAVLTDDGTREGAVLLESGDYAPTYAERSIGLFDPSLRVVGREDQFEIRALDDRGRAMLAMVASRITIEECVLKREGDSIHGQVLGRPGSALFEERLKIPGHADVIRAALLSLVEEDESAADLPIGLFGCFAYDFIRQYEELPRSANDVLGDPDYIFYFSTRLFLVDQVRGETLFASIYPADEPQDSAEADLARMREAFEHAESRPVKPVSMGEFTSDVDRESFHTNVESLKEAIRAGRVFQVVYGRMFTTAMNGDAFTVYRALKRCNPSPYMFYVRDERGVLLGASPELAVRVSREADRRTIEIKPIAGTKPRGLRDGVIDPLLDERYEVSLKIDTKELAEHTMLIDLARNDIASVSKPGTTRLASSLFVEKYSHVQHLVSRVVGELPDSIDALTAYIATMNMGTLTGAPKPEAMRLIAETEESARGFFGGGVGFLTTRGEMLTAIVIRAMRILDGQVHIRAGAGIVADSIPESEYLETERKAAACIAALKEACRNDA